MKRILCGFTPFALAASAFADPAGGAGGSTVTISADAASVAGAVTEGAGTLAPTVLVRPSNLIISPRPPLVGAGGNCLIYYDD